MPTTRPLARARLELSMRARSVPETSYSENSSSDSEDVDKAESEHKNRANNLKTTSGTNDRAKMQALLFFQAEPSSQPASTCILTTRGSFDPIARPSRHRHTAT